jgi:hypothetical protein
MTGVKFALVMHLRMHLHRCRTAWESGEALVIAERPSVADRLAMRWRGHQLARELAAGAAPEADPALALYARWLTALPRRRSMAAAFRRALREAREGRGSAGTRVPVSRERVSAAREELSALADTLARPGPVGIRGAAEARLLLTDGTGPLYDPCSSADLAAWARGATEHLRAVAG